MSSTNSPNVRPLDRFYFLSKYIGRSAFDMLNLLKNSPKPNQEEIIELVKEIQIGMTAIEKYSFDQLETDYSYEANEIGPYKPTYYKLIKLGFHLSESNLYRFTAAFDLAPKRSNEFLEHRHSDYRHIYELNSTIGIGYVYLKEMMIGMLDCAQEIFNSTIENSEHDNKLNIIFQIITNIVGALDAHHFMTSDSLYKTGIRIEKCFYHLFSTESEIKFIKELSRRIRQKGEEAINREFGVSSIPPEGNQLYWPTGISDQYTYRND